jgi:hypothetical protein
VLAWLQHLWDLATRRASEASSLSGPAAVLVLVLVVLLLAWVSTRLRREPGGRSTASGAVIGDEQASPDELRARALRAADEGRYDAAVVDAVRALAARMVRRGLLDARPGMTAHEAAEALAPRFGEHDARLQKMSRLFDAVFYGHTPATSDDAREVLDLEERLQRARPDGMADRQRASTAVPR